MHEFDGLNNDFLIALLIKAIAVVIVTTVFEYTKALVSTMFGDKRPKNEGRLTLNPLKHFEPIGFLFFLFLGYGWGKPVETANTSYSWKGKSDYKARKKCTVVVYVAPMILSLVLAIVSYVGVYFFSNINYVAMLFSYLASCFVSIAVFNIIPVHPLCGNRILKCFLSPNAALKFSQNEKILQMVVIFLLLAGWLRMPLNAIVSKILTIPAYFLVG